MGGPSLSCCRAGKWQRVGGVKDDPQVLMQVGYRTVASFGEAEGGAHGGRGGERNCAGLVRGSVHRTHPGGDVL